jgi:ADP-ribose pyrophosphatase YjhB (NUDIX family)
MEASGPNLSESKPHSDRNRGKRPKPVQKQASFGQKWSQAAQTCPKASPILTEMKASGPNLSESKPHSDRNGGKRYKPVRNLTSTLKEFIVLHLHLQCPTLNLWYRSRVLLLHRKQFNKKCRQVSDMGKRENVWLGVAGLAIDKDGSWLVVKKRYGCLKGSWSLPAGFVDEGETADQAVIREVLEETGIHCKVEGLLGLRTGVIRDSISDNMLVFLLRPLANQEIKVQQSELYEAKFIHTEALLKDKDTSVLLKYLLEKPEHRIKPGAEDLDPGKQFHYTAYTLFL